MEIPPSFPGHRKIEDRIINRYNINRNIERKDDNLELTWSMSEHVRLCANHLRRTYSGKIKFGNYWNYSNGIWEKRGSLHLFFLHIRAFERFLIAYKDFEFSFHEGTIYILLLQKQNVNIACTKYGYVPLFSFPFIFPRARREKRRYFLKKKKKKTNF